MEPDASEGRAPWKLLDWRRHGRSHAWPDWSQAVPRADEGHAAWLARWATALVDELSGPVEMTVPKMGRAAALQWLLAEESGLVWFERDWRIMKGADPACWRHGVASDQELGIGPGRKWLEDAAPGRVGRFFAKLRLARASRRLGRAGEAAREAAAGQRSNARRTAIEALSLMGVGDRQGCMWKWGWSQVEAPACEPLRACLSLCSASLAWVSPDARADACAALLAGIGAHGDAFAGESLHPAGAAMAYFGKAVHRSEWSSKVSRSSGGSVPPPPSGMPHPWDEKYPLAVMGRWVKEQALTPISWIFAPERGFESPGPAMEAARACLWESMKIDVALGTLRRASLGEEGSWRRAAALGCLPWLMASTVAGAQAQSRLAIFFEGVEDCLRWMASSPGSCRAIAAGMLRSRPAAKRRMPSAKEGFPQGSWAPEILREFARLSGGRASSAGQLIEELGVALRPGIDEQVRAALEAGLILSGVSARSDGEDPPARSMRPRL